MRKFFLLFMFFVPAMLFAALGESGVSVAPDGTELKWEEGKRDFFIMHKSLIEEVTGEVTAQTTNNPQADTCIDPNVGSTYTLTSKHIPDDADIDRAFLVWVSTQDPENLEGNTDNSVTLTFTNAADPSITLTKEVTASKQGNLATTQQGDFEYEALNVPGDSNVGPTGFYTYRVEVSGFMKEIIAMGKQKGLSSGEALYGNYNVKGMDCSNHQNYLTVGGLVGGWALPFIYKSSHVFAKKIYFYHGLQSYHVQSSTITVSGFKLPDEAYIKLGLVVFEGDPGLANTLYSSNPEGLAISSQNDPANFSQLFNSCNPPKTQSDVLGQLNYTEIFNSISSIYGWKDKEETCIGNPDDPLDAENPIEYAIDADMFLINTKNPPYDAQFKKDDTEFNIKIGANQDGVYTNFLIISVDTYRPEYDSDDPDAANSPDTDPDDSDSDSTDSGDSDPADTGDTGDTADTDHGDTNPSDTDAGDTGNTDSETKPGEYGGECYQNGTCNEGLTCNTDNICVEPLKKAGSSGCSLLVVD